ncbi:hypothetical protein V865_000949 [Kwoniella europaea PYCC6329]|uniref:PIN domain-containing protein n=1 Tax=Kwoniella europaea PYCC6329 TaxID=1423913 RepID=A0AAX4K8V2_9TREE
MMVRHEEEMIWEPEHNSNIPVHYLAVDTNVFISHLNLIRTIHTLLLGLRPSPIIFLLPSVVIHELDTLKASRAPSAPDSPITLGRLVQAANTWLLEVHRNRRMTGLGALRCQSLKEQWDTKIKDHGQNDDQILDCCLHFANHGAKVTLWTNDKNLSVKAESNDIPTLGAQNMTLTKFFKSIDEIFPETLWKDVSRLSIYDEPSYEHQNGNGVRVFDHDMDMDMDMDHDLHEPITELQSIGTTCQDKEEEEKRYPYLLPQPTFPLPPSSYHPTPSSLPVAPVWSRRNSNSHIPSPTPTQSPSPSPFQQNRQPTSPNSIPMDRHSSSSKSSSKSISMNSRSSVSPTKSSTSRSSIPSRQPSDSTSTSIPANRTPTGPSGILLTSLRLSLRPFAISLLRQCPNPPRPPDRPLDTEQILSALADTLSTLDTTLQQQGEPSSSEIRISLIRSIGAVKTINNYIDNHTGVDLRRSLEKGNRRIRSGEIIQCLENLKSMFKELGLGVDGDLERLDDVIEDIKKLN